jgi:hypothetical protein
MPAQKRTITVPPGLRGVAQEKGSGRPTRMVKVCFDRQTWDLAVVWGI